MTDLFIRGLRIDWEQIPADCYLHDIPSVRGIDQLNFAKKITFFVGENGSGKSTLLEGIATAYGFNPEGGTINYHFSTYDDVSPLADGLTLIKGFDHPRLGYFFRAETFFNVATVGMVEYLGSDYHSNSHGEGFLAFMQGFDKPGLYIIYEPEAALSPQKQLTLLEHIYRSAKNGSQFIIATHSPILLGTPDAEILTFDGDQITPCQYEDTASYQITKLFLQRKDLMLQELLQESQ
jgi:predicted ATPase